MTSWTREIAALTGWGNSEYRRDQAVRRCDCARGRLGRRRVGASASL